MIWLKDAARNITIQLPAKGGGSMLSQDGGTSCRSSTTCAGINSLQGHEETCPNSNDPLDQEGCARGFGFVMGKAEGIMRHVENAGTGPPPNPLCLPKMNQPAPEVSSWRGVAGSVCWPGQSNTESRSQSRPPGNQTKGSGEPGNPTFPCVFPEPANNLDGEC